MFYLFYGSDTEKARAKMHEILHGAKKKRPDAEVFTLEAENFSAGELDALVGGSGLFEKKSIVVMSRILENKEAAEAILERLADMAETENLFLVLEGSLDKKTVSKFEKFAHKIEAFEKKEVTKQKFNVFGMANALGARDRKGLWVLYEKAKLEEMAPEAIAGMLFWKVKAMLQEGRSPKYSKNELHEVSSRLVALYHDSHRGITDFDVALERFILGV